MIPVIPSDSIPLAKARTLGRVCIVLSWWRATTRRRGTAENKRRGEGTIKRPSCVHQYEAKPAKTLASRRWPTFCTRPAKISARQYRTMADCRHYGGHCRGLLIWALLPRVYKLQYRGHLSPSPFLLQSSPFRSRYRRRGLLGKERRLVSDRAPFCCWITSREDEIDFENEIEGLN